MKKYMPAIATILLAIPVVLPSKVIAQKITGGPEWTAVMRAADVLEEGYVIPETASRLAAMLRSRAKEFAAIDDRAEFADAVTAAMKEIANDKHLRVFEDEASTGVGTVRRERITVQDDDGGERRIVRRHDDGNPAIEREKESDADADKVEGDRENEREVKGEKAHESDGADERPDVDSEALRITRPTIESRMLSDQVGYLRLSFFYLGTSDKQKLRAAVNAIDDAQVVVLDLRNVPGGVEEAVMHLSGYFFPQSTHLVTTRRRGEPPIERWSDPSVAEPRFAEEPLYILTNARTGSAAESFVFGMKNTGRATTVGEKTAGAGHFGGMVDLGAGYEMFLPFGRTYNPQTGIGFEATGIPADIAAQPDDALDAILRKAGITVPATEQIGPETVDTSLEEYVGRYGPRSITLKGSELRYRRTPMPNTVAMRSVGIDEFELVVPSGARVRGAVDGGLPTIRFNRSTSGAIESLSIVNPDGSIQETSTRE